MPPRSVSFLFAVSMSSVGCGPDSVCEGLDKGFACDGCPAELTRCEFDGVEVTEPACDTCEARVELLLELCASGSEATFDEAMDGMTCEVVEDTAGDR